MYLYVKVGEKKDTGKFCKKHPVYTDRHGWKYTDLEGIGTDICYITPSSRKEL
jgi:hypothetical protein